MERIQRKRTKGWKMPANTVYVGRPAQWGNPYRVNHEWERGMVVECFDELLHNMPKDELEKYLAPLRGKNLACWCKVGTPCHADILLKYLQEAS